MILRILALSSLFFCDWGYAAERPSEDSGSELQAFAHWLLDDGERLEEVRFAEVVEAVSRCEVLAVDRSDPVDAAVLSLLERTLDAMLEELASSEHAIHQVGRVNEISRYIEDFLLSRLNEADGYRCGIPVNASGDEQRSGYPDLRLLDEASGRVFYLDPKVYKLGSEASSFRTFYFEPKRATNKILDDASHVVVGIGHAGKQDGRWQLKSWKLVDLIDFRVRLKAEFQASNQALYRDESVLSESN